MNDSDDDTLLGTCNSYVFFTPQKQNKQTHSHNIYIVTLQTLNIHPVTVTQSLSSSLQFPLQMFLQMV